MEWVHLAKHNGRPGNLTGAKQAPFGDGKNGNRTAADNQKKHSIVKNKVKDPKEEH